MHEVAFEGVKKYLDTTLLFKNITFLVSEGEKVGMIGDNGCGKSTILKLIAGILKLNHCAGYPYAPVPPGYDEGWVHISKHTKCAYLEQIPQYDENIKVIDVLNLSFEEVHQIEMEIHVLENDMQNLDEIKLNKTLAKYSELVQLYEFMGGYDTEEKLNKICKGLKFGENFLQQNFNSLSGGEKTTVILGKLLMDTPDVLLLDEPTNHLDMESVEWLQNYINNYKGIVIIVSHDRYFLDQVATKIIEVENKECETYTGNYSDYLSQKEENQTIQFNQYKEQKKKIDKMEHSIHALRNWAMQADNNKFFKRATSMKIKLDKMDRIEKPNFEKDAMKMDIKTGDRSGKIVIKAMELSKNFGKKTIFKNADILIRYGESVALIGPNGCGKTTFLKMLFGDLQPDQGEVSLGANIHLAYLPQNITFENDELTLLDYFREDISILEGNAREYLARFMFYGGNVFKKIKLLSGGERIRLKISKLLFQNVNLLILDEPTNHLDIASIESIEVALSHFQGTIFYISHDRYFINKTCDRVIAIEDFAFSSYLGNYDYYKEIKAAKDTLNQQDIPAPNNKKETVSRSENVGAKNDVHVKKKKTEICKMEACIQDMEKQIQEIENRMEAARSDYEELNKLFSEKECLKMKLNVLLENWVNA